jgi:hypothetical protein
MFTTLVRAGNYECREWDVNYMCSSIQGARRQRKGSRTQRRNDAPRSPRCKSNLAFFQVLRISRRYKSTLPLPYNLLSIAYLTPKGYGIYQPDGIFTAPLVEEMADKLPENYCRTVAYPYYRSMLAVESANQPWTWCELVPDAIIGFTPNGSGFSLAGHWAVYLYAYKLVHGEGAKVPYPGKKSGYDSLYTETSASLLARVAIHASLHPENFRERIFNVADSAEAGSMRERWPQIASWFGLKGVEPSDTASASDARPSDFIKDHASILKETGVRGVDIWNAAQLDSYGYWLTFDRQLSLKRLRNAGFEEEKRPEEGWWDAFKMFRHAMMID